MQRIKVEVQADHLQRMLGGRKPLLAVAELAWNAVDADATRVEISFEENGLRGLSAIRIADNGHGISHDEALAVFKRLGGSWKRSHNRSKRGNRILHGRAGEGRFRAFALGSRVVWTTCYQSDKALHTFTVSGSTDELGVFSVTDPVPAQNGRTTGTEVRITGIERNHPSLLQEKAAEELAQLFALYLRGYPDIRVVYNARPLDPGALEKRVGKAEVAAIVLPDGRKVETELEIIEWNAPIERALVLCDAQGFALARHQPGVHAPGYNFTAYLKSDYLRELDASGALHLEELHPELNLVLGAARDSMRGYFRARAAEEAAGVVEEWKQQRVYPFEGEPNNVIEETERQVFDVVALNIHAHLPNFEKSDAKSKKLSLTLLRQAIEQSPAAVQRLLRDVLELPRDKQEELAQLLDKTSLAAIINAAKLVTDRLELLRGLELLVFETREELLETTQLHRILADHTWLFGEEFNLSADDESLTQVLRKHLEKQGRLDSVALDPVRLPDGRKGRVDLMLSRLIPQQRPGEREHLVIELKRPSQPVNSEVLAQVERYATAVAQDERFRDSKTRWSFWALSNSMDDVVRRRARQRGWPEGLVHDDSELRYFIWVKTWGEVLEEAKGRLMFFQNQLRYSATRDSALDYLRRTHEKYLPKKLIIPE